MAGALGGFIRRIVADSGGYQDVARPFRVKRQKIVRSGELDAAMDCPAQLAPALRGRGFGAVPIPVWVVMPKVEVEAWLPGIESLRGAKSALSQLMEANRGYVATDDLPAMLAAIDYRAAAARAPSLDKFLRDLDAARDVLR